MKKIAALLLFLLSISLPAQNAVQLSPDMFIGIQEIQLAQLNGWKFKAGNDVAWAKNDTDISNWQTLGPMDLTKQMADENGRVEGWFKLKVKLDESFGNQQLGIRFYCWAAVDFYIDGKYVKSFGNTGANGKPYKEFNPAERMPILVDMKGGNEYVIAFHFVDEVSTYPAYGIKSNQSGLNQFIKLTGPKYNATFSKYLSQQPIYYAVSTAICGILMFLFLLLALQNKREKFLWLIVYFMILVCLSGLLTIFIFGPSLNFEAFKWASMLDNIIGSLPYLIIPIILSNIFKLKISWDLKCYLFLTCFAFCLGLIPFYQELFYFAAGISCSIYYLISIKSELKNASTKTILTEVFKSLRVFLLMTAVLLPLMYIYQMIVAIIMILVLLAISAYLVLISWKKITGAQWAIIIGLLLTFTWLILGLSFSISYQTTIYPYSRFLVVAVNLSFPLSLLIYVSLRFKEILGEVVALSEEKQQQALRQQEVLEEEVARQTVELRTRAIELEANNRELEIEAALEKVRSRTMAMQHSDELADASFILDSQVRALGIPTWGCAFNIYGENESTEWFSSEKGTLPTYKTPRENLFQRYYEAGQKGETIHIETFAGADCIAHYEYLCTIPIMGDSLRAMIDAGGSFPEKQTDHVAYFKYGYLLFITLDPTPEAYDIFIRFAKVFEQTYTRFLDLQKAEAQALQAEQDLIAIKVAREKAEVALAELQVTQRQLIQSEKMASLGELTAGIAHEIKNPLNFVNNFSDLSIELLDEMETEIDNGDLEEAKAISADIKQNLEKINHHGKRADAIVKGMLQHSRNNSGVKEPTDINALCDEYLRLSYHGLRAKDKSFNATLSTDFEPNLAKIKVIPQDIGRVVLNLLTNAFYAVNEKKQSHANYEPTVSIATKTIGDKIEISVSDNGNGIPQSAIDKIFQPFFTTKPTGKGTGLGLSLSYDIITKGHQGELVVTTEPGESTTFTILLPI